MPGPRLIRFADCPNMPWKNGGGTTKEIAVFPPDSSMDDFIWRLSMARVEQAGPFSPFPGINRVLAVLHGHLMLREVSGEKWEKNLSTDTTPFAFDGSEETFGAPICGPVLDCNAMARAGACQLSMLRYAAGSDLLLHPASGRAAETIILIALQPQNLGGYDLHQYDCLIYDFSADQTETPPLPKHTQEAILAVRFSL